MSAPYPKTPRALRGALKRLKPDVPHIDVPLKRALGEARRARGAAVMMPLCFRDGELCVVLTRRASWLRHHPGEYSFPGGAIEPGDEDALAAALRESFEEIALPPERLEVLGCLASVPTLTGFQIAAFIGLFELSEVILSPQAEEVAHVAITPLSRLEAPGVHRVRIETHGLLTLPIHFYHLDPEQPVWGATAYLLHELIALLDADAMRPG